MTHSPASIPTPKTRFSTTFERSCKGGLPSSYLTAFRRFAMPTALPCCTAAALSSLAHTTNCLPAMGTTRTSTISNCWRKNWRKFSSFNHLTPEGRQSQGRNEHHPAQFPLCALWPIFYEAASHARTARQRFWDFSGNRRRVGRPTTGESLVRRHSHHQANGRARGPKYGEVAFFVAGSCGRFRGRALARARTSAPARN